MLASRRIIMIAVFAGILTSGALMAQQKTPENGITPAGDPTSGGRYSLTLPGTICSEAGGVGCTIGIPDNAPAGVDSTMEIEGCGSINNVDVAVDVTHTWVGDLKFTVTGPDGTSVTIIDRPGVPATTFGCSGDDIYAEMSDSAAFPVEDECANATATIDGIFLPNEMLSAFNGKFGSGTWKMNASDHAAADTGTLEDWSVEIDCGEPTAAASFRVIKDFTDDNPMDVEVTLSCFTGLPLVQSQMISESQDVNFIVESFADGELDCEVTEAPVDGYSASYNDGLLDSDVACEYDDVSIGQGNYCVVTNSPDPVPVTVNKDWIIDGQGGDTIDAYYRLTLACRGEIVGGSTHGPSGIWRKSLYDGSYNGTDDEEYTAEVVPDWDGGTACWVLETVFDSAVEVSNGCGSNAVPGLLVEIASPGDSCTVTNTVFFEGIPTLSQYGLAVLTLLMLGAGFVGFRRLV